MVRMPTPRTPSAAEPVTAREAAKAQRRQDLLDAAAELFAEHGFESVRLEDIGAACGISGPGIYRHFRGKAAVLTQILENASHGLLDGGRAAVAGRSPGAGHDGRAGQRVVVRAHHVGVGAGVRDGEQVAAGHV